MYGPSIDRLIAALRVMPGIGAKSAQRIAMALLERHRDGAQELAASLVDAVDKVGNCSSCRTLCEGEQCTICADQQRSDKQLCIVETPADLYAIEQAGGYRGRYFVLMGHLSPIDGIGPDEIGLPQLEAKLASGAVEELILATNLTVEGETTAHYISSRARGAGVAVSRIAHGVPIGGELEYIDSNTLSMAMQSRKAI